MLFLKWILVDIGLSLSASVFFYEVGVKRVPVLVSLVVAVAAVAVAVAEAIK